jgi:hemoglobin
MEQVQKKIEGALFMEKDKLLAAVGGRPVLEKVHKLFYDKLYEHPWLKKFFKDVPQETIENQQTDFMISNMGGDQIYCGGMPKNVHRHMFITEELFDLRAKILEESILACGVSKELTERWVRIDYAFKHSLVKKDLNECKKRFFTDEIMNFQKP